MVEWANLSILMVGASTWIDTTNTLCVESFKYMYTVLRAILFHKAIYTHSTSSCTHDSVDSAMDPCPATWSTSLLARGRMSLPIPIHACLRPHTCTVYIRINMMRNLRQHSRWRYVVIWLGSEICLKEAHFEGSQHSISSISRQPCGSGGGLRDDGRFDMKVVLRKECVGPHQ